MGPLTDILALGFLSPWLMAAGAAATSIPIIIHLLNKRKFKIVVWAAMEWLIAAQRRNARRLKLQRWLLLLLRCLAILIIAAGIAQMFLQSQAIASFLGDQRAVIILWDDSYSMGFQQLDGAGGQTTAFERSKKLIQDHIGRLHSGDLVLVIRASTGGPEQSMNNKPSPDHQMVLSKVASARLMDLGTDLPGALDRAAQVLTELELTTRSRQLLLVTDFSNSSIHDPMRGAGADNRIEGIQGDRLKKAAKAAFDKASDFRVLNMGADDQMNTAITALSSKQPVAVAGWPIDLQIKVFNGWDRPRDEIPMTIYLDGVPAVTQKLGRIDSGSTRDATAKITVPTIGRHLVEVKLGADQLPLDDERRMVLNVRKDIPILLVDGNPGDGGRTSFGSTAYLAAAYSLKVLNGPPMNFSTKTISELELSTTALSGYDVVVLSDLGAPGTATRETLRRYVQEGGLLMVFPGDRTNAQAMNEALGEKGANLLPATFGQSVSGEVKFAPEGYNHPTLQVWRADTSQGKNVGIDLVDITKYYTLGVPADGSVETILRYARADGKPGDAAVVVKDVGDGKVVQFASTADTAWHNWGAKPSFLPFVHELTYYAMGRRGAAAGGGLTLEAGQKLRLPGDAANPGNWKGPGEKPILVTAETDKDGRAFLSGPVMETAGTYAPPNEARAVVAVNPETREADIRHQNAAQMAGALGVPVESIIERPALVEWATATVSDDSGSYLGPWLVVAAFCIFFLETVLAMVFSMYR